MIALMENIEHYNLALVQRTKKKKKKNQVHQKLLPSL